MLKRILVLAVVLIHILGAGAVLAAETPPRLAGAYSAWEAYVFTENGRKVCYMASQPGNKEGNYTQRDDPFALVTHRPGDGTRNVFSYITGYTYKPGSTVVLTIDDKKFSLFTKDRTAWAPDAATLVPERRSSAYRTAHCPQAAPPIRAHGRKTRDRALPGPVPAPGPARTAGAGREPAAAPARE